MKASKVFFGILFAWILVAWNDAQAGGLPPYLGKCVYPVGNPAAITVYLTPSNVVKTERRVAYAAYLVKDENRNGYVALWSVPDYSKSNPYENDNKFLGWVDKSKVELQDMSSCI